MHSLGRRALAEATGTFFLVFVGPGAVMVNAYSGGAITHPGIALSFGFVLLAMIYALGHVSGAHINPAVTVAFWSIGRFKGREVLPYVLAQCGGGVVASLLLRYLLGPIGNLGATIPSLTVPRAFVVEFILSLGLMLVITAVATDERVSAGVAGMAVGLTLAVEAMMGGPLTGASMNPARSLGPAIAGGGWTAHWIYWVAPVAGMLAAARLYQFLRDAGMDEAVREGTSLGVEGPLDIELRS